MSLEKLFEGHLVLKTSDEDWAFFEENMLEIKAVKSVIDKNNAKDPKNRSPKI